MKGLLDSGAIETFFAESEEVSAFLFSHEELSLAQHVVDSSRRTLVLGIASYFEVEIAALLRDVVIAHAQGSEIVGALIEQKVIARQYHTLFDWTKPNANTFFALFGSAFASQIQADLASSTTLDASIRAFLELGLLRNRLVHGNYLTFELTKTSAEIMELYRLALEFVLHVRLRLSLSDS